MTDTTMVRVGTDPRTLIPPELRDLIAGDLRAKFPGMTAELADAGVGQMAAFLHASATTERPLSPSPLVDDFWHAFVLRTAAYAEWCDKTFGKFVHHLPGLLPVEEGGGKELRQRAVDSIADLGYLLEMEFWPEIELAQCSQCHASCSDSPNALK